MPSLTKSNLLIFLLIINGIAIAQIPENPSSLTHINSGSFNQVSWNDLAINETSYQLDRAESGNTNSYSNIAILAANTKIYIDNNVTQGVTYRYRIKSINETGESDFVYEGNISTTSIVCDQVMCYPEVCSGYYGSSTTYTKTIQSNCTNCTVGISFNRFQTESSDHLTIYDGNSIYAPALGSFSGANIPPFIKATGRALTLQFKSDFTVSDLGWQLNVKCFERPVRPENLSISDIYSSAMIVNWTHHTPNTGFKIEQSTSPSFQSYKTFMLESNATRFVATNLDSTTQYYFRVSALSADTRSFNNSISGKTSGSLFREKTFTNLLNRAFNGEIKIGDYDGDKLYDILVYRDLGIDNITRSKIFHNKGNNHFDLAWEYIPYGNSVMKWEDIDNDNDLDVIAIELDSVRIFINQEGHFEKKAIIKAHQNYNTPTDIVTADYDLDGDIDIFLSSDSEKFSAWYKNNGNYEFSFDPYTAFTSNTVHNAQVADINNDNYPDLIFLEGGKGTQFYLNWQGKSFQFKYYPYISNTDYTYTPSDLDNDGDIDLLMSGVGGNINVYLNKGDDTFESLYSPFLYAPALGKGITGDIDNDGDTDVIYGAANGGLIIINLGKNNFTPISNFSFKSNTSAKAVELVDWDNDGKLDVILNDGKFPGTLWTNKTTNTNNPPSLPGQLISTVVDGTVRLKWRASTDHETVSSALRYNYFIGKSLLTEQVKSSKSCRDNGQQKVLRMETIFKTEIEIKDLENGDYFFGVQAIDGSLKASTFSTSTFQIKTSTSIKSPWNFDVKQYSPYQNNLKWEDRSNNEDAFVVYRSSAFNGSYQEIANLPTNSTVYEDTNLTPSASYFYRVVAVRSNVASSTPSPIIACNAMDRFNSQTNNFVTSPGLRAPTRGDMQWIDFNNDNKRDFVWGGWSTTSSVPSSTVKVLQGYVQSETNSWKYLPLELKINDTSPISVYTSMNWGDVDNDGDLDFVIARTSSISPTCDIVIMMNHGNYSFDPIIVDKFSNTASGFIVRLADYDNDGDLDLMASRNEVTNIYRNNGFGGAFSLFQHIPYGGTPQWMDYNNDGFLDFVMTGSDESLYGSKFFYAYRNNGKTFVLKEKINANNTILSVGDVDNDGDDDLYAPDFNSTNTFFKNDRESDKFILTDLGLNSRSNAGILLDYDNDNLTDLIRGDNTSESIALYKNSPAMQFEFKQTLAYLSNSTLFTNDIDQDSDMDVVVIGGSWADVFVFENNQSIVKVKAKPQTPIELSETIAGDSVVLKWKSGDVNPNLTFNVSIGTTPGKGDIMNALSDPVSGYHKINQPGNAYRVSFKIMKGLKQGIYFWNVQAIDQNFQASNFSAQKSFIVGLPVLPSPGNINATPISTKKIKLIVSDNEPALDRILFGSEDNLYFVAIDTLQGGETEYIHSNLKANRKYYYRFLYWNKNTFSEYSSTASSQTLEAPTIISSAVLLYNEDQTFEIQTKDVNTINTPGYPNGYKILASPGKNFVVQNLSVIQPNKNFNGSINVPVYIANAMDTSASFDLMIKIVPVNDPPEGFSLIKPMNANIVEPLVNFEWIPSIDVDGDLLNYTLHLRSNEDVLEFKNISESHFQLNITDFHQLWNKTVEWWVSVSDGHAQIVSTEQSSFTFLITGLQENLASQSALYPVPAIRFITLNNSDHMTGYTILDSKGILIDDVSVEIEDKLVKIDISNFKAGHYFLKALSLKGIKIYRFVKN